MTADEACDWLSARHGVEALRRLERFVALVIRENSAQNLISPATVNSIWERHVVDSAQLLIWSKPGLWLDIGTGGGFPGMVVALLRTEPMVLVEPRRRRAEFLRQAADDFGLRHVRVEQKEVERSRVDAAVISARAVASVDKLLNAAGHCATSMTRWLLPRGKVRAEDVDELRRSWSGTFHVEQSVTDASSSVLILDGVEANDLHRRR